jgi:hypothetical protein
MDRCTLALTFRTRVAYREHNRWWEIAFAELVSKRLRNLGFHDGRRSNSMVKSLVDDLLRLVPAERVSSVTVQPQRGTHRWFTEASDDDITSWPGSRLLSMR